MDETQTRDVIVVGAGVAGLSAGIYLGRARRDTLIVSAGNSMAAWEPDVQNYLGFPDGVSGEELIDKGKSQASRYGAQFCEDEIDSLKLDGDAFVLISKKNRYRARKVLLATGIFHLPPEINGVEECLGHSMFFCKDCDGFRVQNKCIVIFGNNNETVEYALGMLTYTASVSIILHGKQIVWDKAHADWISEYKIPIHAEKIRKVEHDGCQLRTIVFENDDELAIDSLFTTRGDIYYNELAKSAGAKLDDSGEIVTDTCLMTSVRGLYAAGCVTAANCQMIIAAGEGATAAQAINRALFEESLASHSLRRTEGAQTK